MAKRTVNFKGMVVSHYPDGHYQIVGPPSPPNPLDDWMFSFQVPPLFLWWSAKHVVIATLLADVLFTIIFLFNATDLFSCLLLVSISISLLFAVGYMHESLLAIFLHFVACLGHIATITIFVPVVYFNNTVCNNAVQCKTFHEWMELIGAPIVTSKVYVYAVVSMAFHIIMTPISLRMVKYAAAVDAVERYTKAESKKRMAREAASAKLAIVETTLA